jgi:hypothetical protein
MVNHERGIAISCARNMETAQHVANGIISGSNDGTDWQYPIPPIEAIGRKVLLSAGERRDAQCLIVLMSPSPRLFLFQFAMVNGEWGPICQPMETWAFAGDNVNPAVFWAERYYEELPIERLIPLASHTILAAGRLNPTAIKGLEIVLCGTSGIRRVSEESIRELELKTHEWHTSIGDLFLKDRPQLTYAPNMID